MDFISPILSIAGATVGKTIDKFNYKNNKIAPNQLLFLLFATMVAGLLISLLFIRQPLPAVTLATFTLMMLMVIVSYGQNFFDYVGLHTKNLSLREPIQNFKPILASFLAYALFPSERNIKYIVAIMIGVAVLYATNSNRSLKLKFDMGTVYLFLGVVCSAVLTCIYKVGLESISPFYLLLIRAAGVLLLVQIFFRPHLRSLRKNQLIFGVGSGFFYVIGNLAQLYSIKYLGLTLTIMILLFSPALVYISSAIILKEKVLPKQIIASATLLAVVIWAIYL